MLKRVWWKEEEERLLVPKVSDLCVCEAACASLYERCGTKYTLLMALQWKYVYFNKQTSRTTVLLSFKTTIDNNIQTNELRL